MARVTVTYDNHIAFVRLTRADKMNAVDQEMIDGIIEEPPTAHVEFDESMLTLFNPGLTAAP